MLPLFQYNYPHLLDIRLNYSSGHFLVASLLLELRACAQETPQHPRTRATQSPTTATTQRRRRRRQHTIKAYVCLTSVSLQFVPAPMPAISQNRLNIFYAQLSVCATLTYGWECSCWDFFASKHLTAREKFVWEKNKEFYLLRAFELNSLSFYWVLIIKLSFFVRFTQFGSFYFKFSNIEFIQNILILP